MYYFEAGWAWRLTQDTFYVRNKRFYVCKKFVRISSPAGIKNITWNLKNAKTSQELLPEEGRPLGRLQLRNLAVRL